MANIKLPLKINQDGSYTTMDDNIEITFNHHDGIVLDKQCLDGMSISSDFVSRNTPLNVLSPECERPQDTHCPYCQQNSHNGRTNLREDKKKPEILQKPLLSNTEFLPTSSPEILQSHTTPIFEVYKSKIQLKKNNNHISFKNHKIIDNNITRFTIKNNGDIFP